MPLTPSYLAALTGTVLAACVVYNAVQGVRAARRRNKAACKRWVDGEMKRMEPKLSVVRGGKQ